MGKIGRNEKCPCGSGKKYKNCCMMKEEFDLLVKSEMDKYGQAEKDLAEVIMRYVKSKENETDFQSAIEQYFNCNPSEINLNDTEFSFFMAWYIKNYNINNPFIDRLIKAEKKYMPENTKELLEGLKDSGLYLYKVQELKNDTIILENLHTGLKVKVFDKVLEQNVNVDDVIYTRLYKVGKLYRLFGGTMFIPYFMVNEIFSAIDKVWNSSDKSITYNEFLQEYSIEIIKKLNTDIPDDRILYNEDDELLQYSVVKYKILDMVKCCFILDSMDEFNRIEDDIDIVYQWKKYKNNIEFMMGEVTISEQELKLEIDSFERKEVLQKLLEQRLESVIEFIGEDYFTIRQLQEETSNVSEEIKASDEIERLILDNMKSEYSPIQIRDAMFLAKTNKSRLKKLKPESIASAIEYIIVTQHNLSRTQKDIADKYNVSPSTIAKWAKDIKDINKKDTVLCETN